MVLAKAPLFHFLFSLFIFTEFKMMHNLQKLVNPRYLCVYAGLIIFPQRLNYSKFIQILYDSIRIPLTISQYLLPPVIYHHFHFTALHCVKKTSPIWIRSNFIGCFFLDINVQQDEIMVRQCINILNDSIGQLRFVLENLFPL